MYNNSENGSLFAKEFVEHIATHYPFDDGENETFITYKHDNTTYRNVTTLSARTAISFNTFNSKLNI